MNFFKRRKILKKTNFLDLRPVRTLSHQLHDNGKITLLMPRFKNKINAALFQPPSKERHIFINLDLFGSRTWLYIDGEKNVAEISKQLGEQFPETMNSQEETDERVTKFLSLLYQQRYITFREIEGKNPLNTK